MAVRLTTAASRVSFGEPRVLRHNMTRGKLPSMGEAMMKAMPYYLMCPECRLGMSFGSVESVGFEAQLRLG